MTEHAEDPVVIVGAGQAGSELAWSLRQQGLAGRLMLVGDESYLPYQRPPLSKAFLSGAIDVPALYVRQQAAYDRAAIECLHTARVGHIDRAARTLALSDGRELRYGALALTLGGRPRKLTFPEAGRAESASNFHYVRTIEDVLRLRTGFRSGQRLVIIGGGYIGLEVAAVAKKIGLLVTVLEAMPRVLARVTAPEMSIFYERVHRDAGVDVRTGVGVLGFEFDVSGEVVRAVVCNEGTSILADVVVAGIGLIPNTELAFAAGLEVDNGIVVDEFARTSDPAIVAAGDCTSHPSLLYGRRIRLESVPNAMEQARTAAATLVGKPRRYDSVPWFWSDQYDLKLQMVGLSTGYDEVAVRGAMSSRSFATFYLRGGELIACDAVNRPQEFMAAKRLVAGRCRIDAALLADDSVPVKALLNAALGTS